MSLGRQGVKTAKDRFALWTRRKLVSTPVLAFVQSNWHEDMSDCKESHQEQTKAYRSCSHKWLSTDHGYQVVVYCHRMLTKQLVPGDQAFQTLD